MALILIIVCFSKEQDSNFDLWNTFTWLVCLSYDVLNISMKSYVYHNYLVLFSPTPLLNKYLQLIFIVKNLTPHEFTPHLNTKGHKQSKEWYFKIQSEHWARKYDLLQSKLLCSKEGSLTWYDELFLRRNTGDFLFLQYKKCSYQHISVLHLHQFVCK